MKNKNFRIEGLRKPGNSGHRPITKKGLTSKVSNILFDKSKQENIKIYTKHGFFSHKKEDIQRDISSTKTHSSKWSQK